jgi:hypothetical protein
MDATRKHRAPPVKYQSRNNTTPNPQNRAKQAHAGHTVTTTSYPQAELIFASLAFGSWLSTSICCLQDFQPHGNKTKIQQAVPAIETSPLSLTAPHLLPFSPLSPEEGTSRKRLGKPLDFILLHPLNGQKTKENRCRRQYFQLAT